VRELPRVLLLRAGVPEETLEAVSQAHVHEGHHPPGTLPDDRRMREDFVGPVHGLAHQDNERRGQPYLAAHKANKVQRLHLRARLRQETTLLHPHAEQDLELARVDQQHGGRCEIQN